MTVSNLDAFAKLIAEALRARFGRRGEPLRVARRFRTTPHGARKAKRRRVNAAARQARKHNRTKRKGRKGRKVPPKPRRG